MAVYSQLIARECGSATPKAGEYSKIVVEGAKRMHSFIQDLLRVAEPHAELAIQCLEVSEVMNEAIAIFEQPLKDSGGQVMVETALPKLVALVLRQAFQNLLSNALKYGSSERTLEIRIRTERHADEWVFSVSDNGQGIPPEYRNRLFEWFSRVPGTQTSGLGIGLASVKRMLERVGGRIWFEPRSPEGTTFYFPIPVADRSIDC